ncbi:hypothetical protein [Candidatus Nitrosocosmicus franklandus]|uniref:Uncharacterized protein n=1 Tax=Candidatus Nitrosocosmicus franklandianus TaxID=1798806 RepID=A0A484IFI4_9ARCH|nr:hypothetical protein [Candidatus Nitrosocosmicus franklandus]VFJ14392.1 protein of unknown function [Candidatus Nitrosocosmicus franklandus]
MITKSNIEEWTNYICGKVRKNNTTISPSREGEGRGRGDVNKSTNEQKIFVDNKGLLADHNNMS